MYLDLTFDNPTPGNLLSGLETNASMTVFTGVALYEVVETPTSSISLGGGFRYFDTDTTLTLRPGTQPQRQVNRNGSWTDPIIAAFGQFQLSDKWRATVAADYGGFGNNRETYQITATFDYTFADNWSARFGYRHLKVDNRSDDFRAELSGPVIGVSYRF